MNAASELLVVSFCQCTLVDIQTGYCLEVLSVHDISQSLMRYFFAAGCPCTKFYLKWGNEILTPTFLLRYVGTSGRHKEGRLYRVFPMPQNTLMANKFYIITNLYSRKQDIKIFPESGFKTIINSKFG